MMDLYRLAGGLARGVADSHTDCCMHVVRLRRGQPDGPDSFGLGSYQFPHVFSIMFPVRYIN